MKTCYYCGDIATDRDHVIPVASKSGGRHYHCETVPACSRCNSWLGARPLHSKEERLRFIIKKLKVEEKKKRGKIDKEELASLGPSLRKQIEKQIRDYARTYFRLIYAESKLK